MNKTYDRRKSRRTFISNAHFKNTVIILEKEKRTKNFTNKRKVLRYKRKDSLIEMNNEIGKESQAKRTHKRERK